MIGSGFLSSSSWHPDVDPDTIPFADGSLAFIEDLGNMIESATDFGEKSCSTSPIYSSSSDECDFLPFKDDIELNFPVPDDVLTSELLDEEFVDSMELGDLVWPTILSNTSVEEKVTTDSSHTRSSSPEAPRKKRKKTKLSDHSSSSKSWSRMSVEERLKTAHALSQIISHRMAFTDQLEIIKLINPSVVLSPTAKDFTINLSLLNNAKLKRIKEYVRKHAFQLNDEVENSFFREVLESPSSNSSGCHPSKRKQKKCKPPVLQEVSDGQKKLIQQDRKEKQSGLFVKEKIIKKQSNPEEEEEEINILE